MPYQYCHEECAVMHVAIYARVSTERQERQQTIDSQFVALQAWAASGVHDLDEAHVFRDEGYSGARLDRPGLDALRDVVRDGAVEHVAMLSPDRLARRYAYQVLLLEEFRKAGCQVTFLQHPISDDPNDQLLLQIQGAIAEYERAVMGERFRRGKLQKAREGHYQCSRAPYGYRYVPRHDTVPGHLVIDEAEADLVRMIYGWLTQEQLTIRQILKRLNAGPHFPRSGRHPWSPSVVHHILADPVYAGTAYANRYSFVPPKKPRRNQGPRSHEASCRQPKPRELWIAIPVPPLVEADAWDRAQAQLARNAALSFRNNTKHNYLLRCLLTCQTCGLAMFGRTYPATASQLERRYYQCRGKDCILTARPARCPSRNVKAADIDTAVWNHVAGLLADPARLVAQFARFAAVEATDHERTADQLLRHRVERTERADKRLLDAYEAGAISLAEMSERRCRLAEERRGLERQRQDRERLRQQHAQAEAIRTSLEAFCVRVGSRLENASLADKQAILQLVIERVIVGDGSLEIRHVIPLSPNQPSGSGVPTPHPQLRSDGVHDAGLNLRPREHGANRFGEALQPVGHRNEDVLDTAVLQLVHHPEPELGALGLLDPQAQHLLRAVRADAEGDVHRLVPDGALVSNLDPQGVEEDQRVKRLERTLLPFGDFVQHGIRHGADQVGRDVDAVEIAQVALDLPRTHAPGVHRHDLVVEAWKTALVFGNQLRVKGREPVARDLEVKLARAGQHRLAAIAVAAVGSAIRLTAVEMVLHFGVEYPFGQAFDYPHLEQAGRRLAGAAEST
jgi:site-specific DNA recombinase